MRSRTAAGRAARPSGRARHRRRVLAGRPPKRRLGFRARTRIAFGSDAGVAAVHALPIPSTASAFPSDTASRRPGSNRPRATSERSSRSCGSSPSTGRPPALRRAGSFCWTRRERRRWPCATGCRALEEDLSSRPRGRRGLGEHPRPPVGQRGGLGQPSGRRTWRGNCRRRRGNGSARRTADPAADGHDDCGGARGPPEQIQTIGHAVSPERARDLPSRIAPRGVKRFVPVADDASFRARVGRAGFLAADFRHPGSGVIRDHEFNGAWWGERVGIVEDPAFFARTGSGQRAAWRPTRGWSFDARLEKAPDPWQLAASGFAQVDTQMRFRIALNRLDPRLALGRDPGRAILERGRPSSSAPRTGRSSPREIPPPARSHRSRSPGATPSGPRALRERSPEWCVAVGAPENPQGWFLAEPEGGHLHLALAMLRRDAAISGLDLYAAALGAFGARGVRLGEARFSIENAAVHNIYARLGAIFVERSAAGSGRPDDQAPIPFNRPSFVGNERRYMDEARRARPHSPATGAFTAALQRAAQREARRRRGAA